MRESQIFDQLADRAQAGKTWLFDHALPLWWEHGYDRQTLLFNELIDQHGVPAPAPRRVRVQARQVIVYARAGKLGWDGPWREAVDAGVEAVLTSCLREDGGAYHTLAPDGAPLDVRRDLYDLAFIILAFAEAAPFAARTDLIARAEDILAWIESHWAHSAGGFSEGEFAPAPPRRQNPHMHLLEALQGLYEASNDRTHLARAERLATLARTHFYDGTHSAISEFFDDAWRPLSGAEQRLEPGHQFEWCWLLRRQHELGGDDTGQIDANVRRFAERYGVSAQTRAVYDALNLDGSVRAATSRLWPQTERLKANAITFAHTGEVDAGAAAIDAFDTMFRYFETPVRGLWRDRLDEHGAFIEEPAPASTFYHIIMAIAELVRAVDATRSLSSRA